MAGPPILPPPKGGSGPPRSSSPRFHQNVPARPVYVPPSSLYARPAPPHLGIPGVVGHAISNVGAATQHAVKSATTPHNEPLQPVSQGPSDQAVTAFKNTPAYQRAVIDVFLRQPKAQALAILRGAQRAPSYEGDVIRGFLKDRGLSISPVGQMHMADPFSSKLDQFRVNTGPIGAAKHFEQALTKAGQGIGHLIDYLPSPQPQTNVGQAMQATAQGLTPTDVAKNFLKDAGNLSAEVGPSIALPVGQALRGDVPGALKTAFVNPITQTAEHFQQSAQGHPLYTYLIASGLVHGGTTLADQAARRVAGKPTVFPRPSVQVTGDLTYERPNYSRAPLIRQSQKAVERHKFAPSPDHSGALVPRDENVRQKLIKQGTSQRVGMNERIRRFVVAAQERAHAKQWLLPKAQRAAHATKTTLKHNPEPAVIRGAAVGSLIEQGIIRRPETAVADFAKHLNKVNASRGDLLGFPDALAEHDAYVAHLEKELSAWRSDKNLPRSLKPAFAAATEYAHEHGAHGFDTYDASLEAQAHKFGHFAKGVTRTDLERRALTPIVTEHHPDAHFDPVWNTAVRRGTAKEVTAWVSRLRGQASELEASLRPDQRLNDPALNKLEAQIHQLRGTHEVPMPTPEMRTFALNETGGRPIAYASHQAPKGDSAFYRSSEKFPAQATQRNSYFALQHGLIDPSHEALLQQRVHLQGVVSAHKSMGRLLGLLTEKNGGGYWSTRAQAQQDAKAGYSPIYVGRIHGNGSDVTPSAAVNASSLETEALRHSLDINARLHAPEQQGKWALIHDSAVQRLRQHENQVSPNEFLRAARAATTQFRKVALGLSAKHIPGIITENLIRDIASGVFLPLHIRAFRNVHDAAMKIDPELAAERKIEQTGGQVAGATRALSTRQTSRQFAGTSLYKPLKAIEDLRRVPGPRQLSTAWNAWLRFALDGTKKYIEETHQEAAVGKQLLQEYGSLMRLQGNAAHEAAVKGYLPDVAGRRLRAGTERMFGHWTDLSPSAQTALMFSPFGMWWVNSVKWLARLPIDHPVLTGGLASTSMGTAQQRAALGFDMFAPNHLPLYEQGGIPSGGKVFAQNYYSPFGVANDPLETAQSLIAPMYEPLAFAAVGDNWLGREMKSPQHPHGGETNAGQRAVVALNSVLGMFIPLYQKAQTMAQGGASSYDTSTLFNIQTKGPNPGFGAGLAKAFTPLRTYKIPGAAGSSSGGSSSGGGSGGGAWTTPSGSGGAWH